MNRFSRSSSYPKTDLAPDALLGDGFVPDSVLEDWVRLGSASREGAHLALSDGRRFILTDGLRILGRRNGESDPYGLTGRILTLRSVLRRGALLSADGIRLGAVIYDVEFGVVAESAARSTSSSPPKPRAASSAPPASPR